MLLIRPSTDADVPALTALYAHHVLHATGTFELDAPDAAEMAQRRAAVRANGLPWLVAEQDGALAGYACANLFRPRRAYRFCVEDSVYVAPGAQRRGVGRLLLAELIARCEAAGARQMLALIGDSANVASVALHESLGFRHTGLLQASGWKFDRWLDVVVMQRPLGMAQSSAPRE